MSLPALIPYSSGEHLLQSLSRVSLGPFPVGLITAIPLISLFPHPTRQNILCNQCNFCYYIWSCPLIKILELLDFCWDDHHCTAFWSEGERTFSLSTVYGSSGLRCSFIYFKSQVARGCFQVAWTLKVSPCHVEPEQRLGGAVSSLGSKVPFFKTK